MTFSNDKPIYIQMADRLCDEILSGVYQDDDRIPSVREYSAVSSLKGQEFEHLPCMPQLLAGESATT